MTVDKAAFNSASPTFIFVYEAALEALTSPGPVPVSVISFLEEDLVLWVEVKI